MGWIKKKNDGPNTCDYISNIERPFDNDFKKYF